MGVKREKRDAVKVKQFVDWLRQGYWNWQRTSETLDNISKFAAYIDPGITQQNMSRWLNGQSLPRGENVNLLARKLGNEIYEILEIEIPVTDPRLKLINKFWDVLPDGLKNQLADTAARAQERKGNGQTKEPAKPSVAKPK